LSKQIIISMLELGRAELERTAKAVPEDKLNWRPLDNGRPVLDLLGSAAQGPGIVVGILNGTLKFGPELMQQLKTERDGWTREEALRQLEENTKTLIAEVESRTEEQLNELVTLPFNGGTTLPLGAALLRGYRFFMSRTAQINYIQTLYGDFEMH
jgi:hypothetical protein